MKTLGLAILFAWGSVAPVLAQKPEQKKATVAYLRGLQTKGGGFLGAKPTRTNGRKNEASLRATTAALRALKYFGGKVPDEQAAVRFVRNCFQRDSGGFTSAPGGPQPDVITTAVGLMAVMELKMPLKRYAGAVEYLHANAKTFEEIRMAAAGLEAIHQRPAWVESWLKQVVRLRSADGSYGRGDGKARLTGSAVVTVMRLGGKGHSRERVLAVLNAGQRKDGGFGKENARGSDLETCYRVMRAFVMLEANPGNVGALRQFVGRCRNTDGGYGIAPGQSSNVAATYFASTVLHWLDKGHGASRRVHPTGTSPAARRLGFENACYPASGADRPVTRRTCLAVRRVPAPAA
jgi:hypothetical protein